MLRTRIGKVLAVTAVVATLCMGIVSLPGKAWADVTVVPMTVVIEGRERAAEVTLINTADKSNSYEIEWRFYKMEENTGRYNRQDMSVTDFDLTKHIVFTPKRVTLGPKETQKVRLGLRLNGEPPPPGDYRGHLTFKQIKDRSMMRKKGEKGEQAVSVGINIGFSIPVIYRVGQPDDGAKIGKVTLAPDEKGRLAMTIPVTRTNTTPYGAVGNMRVFFTPAGGGGERQVAEIRNANIFPEITHRDFQTYLTEDPKGPGTFRLFYQYFEGERGLVYDEVSVPFQ